MPDTMSTYQSPYYMPNYDMCRAMYNPKSNPVAYPFIPIDEEFRQISLYIPELEDYYFVSNYGRVYNHNTKFLIYPSLNHNYEVYVLRRKKEYIDQGAYETYTVSSQILVCTCFIAPKPGKEYRVTHYDNDNFNNYYRNLGWEKPTPPTPKYSSSNSSKYNETQVRFVCELLQNGVTDYGDICKRVFGCEIDTSIWNFIYNIHNRRNWINISKNYKFEGTMSNRSNVPDFIINMIFSFMKERPDIMNNSSITGPLIFSYMGINLDIFDETTRTRYLGALNRIRTVPNSYKEIRDKYGL